MSNSGTRGPTPLDNPVGDYSSKGEYIPDLSLRNFSNNHSDNKLSGLPPFSSFSGIEGLGSRLHMEGISEGLSARLLDSDSHNIVFGDLYSEGLSARLIERGVIGNVHTNGQINGDQVRNSDTPSTTSVPQYRPWEAKPEPQSPVTTSTWPDSTGNITSFTEAFTELGTNPNSGSLFSSHQKLPSFQSQFTAFTAAGDNDNNTDQGLPSFHILTNLNPRMTSLVPVSPDNQLTNNMHQYVGDQSFALENIPSSSPSTVPSMQNNTQIPSPNSNHSSGYPRSSSVKSELNDNNQFTQNENMDAQRPRSHPMTGIGVSLESLTSNTSSTYLTASDRQNSNITFKTIESAYPRKRESRKKPRTSSIEGSESDTSVSGSVDSVSQVASVSSTENTEGFKPPLNPMEDQEKPVKKKRKRCGECVGCQRKDNCGECAPCRNEKSHQICKMRRCEKLTEKRPNPRGEGKMDGRGRQSSGNSGQMMSMYNTPTNNSAYTLPSTTPITNDRNFGVTERFSSPICYQNQAPAFGSNFNVIGSQHGSPIGLPYGQTIQAYEFATQGNFLPGNQHTPPPPYPVVTQSEISHSFVNSPQSNGGPPTPVSVGSDLSVNSNGPSSSNLQYIESSAQPSSFGSPGGIIRNGQILLHERPEQTNLHIVLPAAHIPSFQSKGYHDLSFSHPQSLPSPHNNTGSPHNLNYSLERKSYTDPGYPNGKPGYQTTKTPLKSSPSCSDDTDASSPRYSGDVRGAESTLRGHLLQNRDWKTDSGALEEDVDEVSTSVSQTGGGEEDDELRELIACVIPLNGLPKLDKMLDDFRNTTWSKSESPAFDNIPGFADKINMSPDQSDKSTFVSSSTQKFCIKEEPDDLIGGPESVVHSTTSFEDPDDSGPKVRYLGMVASHQMTNKDSKLTELETISSVSSSSNFLVRKTTGTGIQVSGARASVSLPVVLKTMYNMGSFSLLEKLLRMIKTNVTVKLIQPAVPIQRHYRVKTLRFLQSDIRNRFPSEHERKRDGFLDDTRHISFPKLKLAKEKFKPSPKKVPEVPKCSCPVTATDNSPYYTHLGAASSLSELRELMEKLSGETGKCLRFEKLIHTQKPGRTPIGCPMAKWVREAGARLFDLIGGIVRFHHFILLSIKCQNSMLFSLQKLFL